MNTIYNTIYKSEGFIPASHSLEGYNAFVQNEDVGPEGGVADPTNYIYSESPNTRFREYVLLLHTAKLILDFGPSHLLNDFLKFACDRIIKIEVIYKFYM